MIAGRNLEETGGATIKFRQTLDMAADSIGQGQPIPKEVVERLQKPLYPPSINILFGGIIWRARARKKGMKGSIKARPYQR